MHMVLRRAVPRLPEITTAKTPLRAVTPLAKLYCATTIKDGSEYFITNPRADHKHFGYSSGSSNRSSQDHRSGDFHERDKIK